MVASHQDVIYSESDNIYYVNLTTYRLKSKHRPSSAVLLLRFLQLGKDLLQRLNQIVAVYCALAERQSQIVGLVR